MSTHDFNDLLVESLQAALTIGYCVEVFTFSKVTKKDEAKMREAMRQATSVVYSLKDIPETYSYGIAAVFVDVSKGVLNIEKVRQRHLVEFDEKSRIGKDGLITAGIQIMMEQQEEHLQWMHDLVNKIRAESATSFKIRFP